MKQLSTTQCQALRNFELLYGSTMGAVLGWAPGRINLIGEHTDYNEGFVLPMAIDKGIAVVLRPRDDLEMRIHSVSLGETVQIPVSGVGGSELPSWVNYAGGVVASLVGINCLDSGVDALIFGDLPMGGGLSSSAALETATAMAMQATFNLSIDPVDMALLCQSVEHLYAGVQCGIMDQFASRLGRAGSALLLDCRTFHVEEVCLNFDDTCIVVVDTLVPRMLDGSAFNERVTQCNRGAEEIGRLGYDVSSLRDVTEAMLRQAASQLDETVYRRCRHVVRENERVLDSVEALKNNNCAEFGSCMYRSHESLRDDYSVSCPELDFVVDSAKTTSGVHGARMTGAGFGGNAIVLLDTESIDAFRANLVTRYMARFGYEPKLRMLGETQPAFSVAIAP